MIIDKLYLKKFGKFENKEIDFSPSLNIFMGNNEAGKSTISTALKTFFYTELNGGGKYKKNYIPLNEEKGLFDVSFTLSDKSKLKGLVTLGKTNAKTLVKVINENSGEELNIDSKKCGECFFNLTEEMFDSVCFIKGLEDISMAVKKRDDIHDKLSKSENNIFDIDLSFVLKDLKDTLNVYGRKTDSGKIYPLKERLSEVNHSIDKLVDIKNSLKEIDIKTEFLEKEEKTISENLSTYKEKSEYLKIYKEYKKAKEQLNLIKDIENLKNELNSKNSSFTPVPEEDLLKLKNYESIDLNPKKVLMFVLIGLGVLIGSFALSFLNIFFSAFSLLSALFFIISYKNKKENEKIIKEKCEYETCLNKYNIKSVDEYNINKENYLKEENEKNLLKQKIEFLEAKKEPFSEEYAYKILNEPTEDEETLKEKIVSEEKRLTEITISKNALFEKKKNAFNNMPDFYLLNEEKKDLEEKIEKLKEEEEIIADTIKIFTLTNDSFKSSYIPYLNKEVKNILSEILDEEIDYFNINDDLYCEIRRVNEENIIPKDNFSKGTDSLIYFALRLAIYKLISKDEEIPLILDDCFLEIDDNRFEKIFKYIINNINSQVIYFTSQKRIFDLPLAKDYINRL